MNADVFVSVPLLNCHILQWKLTGCMKWLMGLVL
ncbi:TPA: DUF362 domain-containing protein [Aeromonas salmonicida]|nr:DUF362 domain-containing protein [Aeromonas salmonicida]ELI6446226.1 DUF362 domain-containing protein [Aeromonas salmonicida subsp. salmonicida]EKP0245555.1 DUF362 domain-containing protein [Aeromonas salmonicida]EKP0254127.1 DUF362 domain-containing protein [Aeromonas salmonicida]EKP0258313.1 DUF362 domain-containing protein [Aeromonas salmonicida]